MDDGGWFLVAKFDPGFEQLVNQGNFLKSETYNWFQMGAEAVYAANLEHGINNVFLDAGAVFLQKIFRIHA